MNVRQINPDQFEGRIIFVSMFNDIDWTQNGHFSECILNAREVSDYAKKFLRGHWSFLGPGDEEKSGMERAFTSQKEMGTASQSND